MKTVTRRWFVGVCAAALCTAACLSPTLPPLPPPAQPTLEYESPGQLRIQGTVRKARSVSVIAINNDSGAIGGRVVRDGKYSFRLEAQPGDEIELWYEVGADVSDSLFLEAPALDKVGTTDAGKLDASDSQGFDAGP